MPKVSIAIPYTDGPKTATFLTTLLASIAVQTFKDYEIVLVNEGPFARNHNAAILKSKGELIKLMQMDDYFSSPQSLQTIVDGFQEDTIWQFTSSLHDHEGAVTSPHHPYWTDDIYTGNNRLGSPSALTFRRENTLLFEEPLTWVVDCDLYYRFYLKYGPPQILDSLDVVIDTRTDRLSSTLSDQLKDKEIEYLTRKYHHA
jgi:glycosyltransferase involved in cell wall biosynthesis